jgi:hypothetical protein
MVSATRVFILLSVAAVALTIVRGPMAKHYNLEAEPGHFEITGHPADLMVTTIRTAVEKNWPLIVLYLAITMGGWISSYFTSRWWSVGISVAGSIVTFAVGWYMLQQVVTITKTIR